MVYYWFDERGRKIADEFLAKWYLFADAIVVNRTDGALVRLTTQIYDGETERDADQRLETLHAQTLCRSLLNICLLRLHLRSNRPVLNQKIYQLQ